MGKNMLNTLPLPPPNFGGNILPQNWGPGGVPEITCAIAVVQSVVAYYKKYAVWCPKTPFFGAVTTEVAPHLIVESGFELACAPMHWSSGS